MRFDRYYRRGVRIFDRLTSDVWYCLDIETAKVMVILMNQDDALKANR
jgi:hypothetical protein